MEVVDNETGGRLVCTMPGRFRMQGIRPIVGDRVEYSLSG
ncbi:MAG: ribosome small subunit-dependent GTPase A, partial [Kosmotogaceae bacterium]